MIHANTWWWLWNASRADWTAKSYFLMLAGPLLLYLAADLLIPSEAEAAHYTVETHYFPVRRIAFSLLAAFVLWKDVAGLVLGTYSVFGIQPEWIVSDIAIWYACILSAATQKRSLHLVALFITLAESIFQMVTYI